MRGMKLSGEADHQRGAVRIFPPVRRTAVEKPKVHVERRPSMAEDRRRQLRCREPVKE